MKVLVFVNRVTPSVTSEFDSVLQSVIMPLHAVVTVDLCLKESRYAKLPNIMKAKLMPIQTASIDDLGVSLKSHQSILKVSRPFERQIGVMVASVAELVEKLKNEAKVI